MLLQIIYANSQQAQENMLNVLVIKELQTKTTVGYRLLLTSIARSKNTKAMAMRMWRNQNIDIVPMGIQNVAATLENSVTFSQNVDHRVTC